MPFAASNGLTEAGTSRSIQAGGMSVHYHDVGTGDPVLFLHSYGPGTTAWITFHKDSPRALCQGPTPIRSRAFTAGWPLAALALR